MTNKIFLKRSESRERRKNCALAVVKARSHSARRRTSTSVRQRTTSSVVVRCRPLSSIVVRYCPLSSVVARQITCIGMLMICKYSSEMAECAVADVVMAAATFFVMFEDEEQEEQRRRDGY